MTDRKFLSILGSTGSVGANTLEIVRQFPNQFEVVALSCRNNLAVFESQILEFRPRLVSVQDEATAQALKQRLNGHPVEIVFGDAGNCQVATHPKAQVVVAAMVGAAGLLPVLSAIEAKKEIALANKETLIMAGELVSRVAKQHDVRIIPIDSEHSAIFQCLQGNSIHQVRKLILTASGGPFLHCSLEQLKMVTLDQALKHPNWKMGPKITIDSATLMNKGLEVLEAYWLFNVTIDQIEVVVHPQSVIHSMVEYCDGSVMAQLGIPDMRIPIAYALSYPQRLPNSLPSVNWFELKKLEFYPPDLERFPCLSLAKRALTLGGDAACVLNAANEVAVEAFLKGKIAFLEIPKLIREVLDGHIIQKDPSLEILRTADQKARQLAWEKIK